MSTTSGRMSIEATAAAYERYVAGHGDDQTMLADDLVFRVMATGRGASGA